MEFSQAIFHWKDCSCQPSIFGNNMVCFSLWIEHDPLFYRTTINFKSVPVFVRCMPWKRSNKTKHTMLLPKILGWQLQFIQRITTFFVTSLRGVPIDFLRINEYLLYILDTELRYQETNKFCSYFLHVLLFHNR